MAFNGMTLTTLGVDLQTKIQAGTTAAFTKIKLGDGTLPVGGTLEALTDLVSPKLIVNIESVTSLGDGTWRVRGTLTNTGLATGFFVREVGLFATDPDEGEILYSVANAGSECDYLPAGGGAVVVEQVVDIVVAISSSATVTATINEGAVLVSLELFNEHSNNKDNPHEVKAEQLGLSSNTWNGTTTYSVGDIRYPFTNPTGYMRLECVVAGTSGAVEPSWTGVGSLVTDGTVTWIVDDVRDGTPVGRAVPEILTAARAGYLKANGALVSRASYPRLWAWANATGLVATEAAWSGGQTGRFSVGDGATTFRLPDLRGEFLRGLDDGRGVDADRVMGAAQADQIQGHLHLVSRSTGSGALPAAQMTAAASYDTSSGIANEAIGVTTTIIADGTNGTPRVGAETRARNIAYLYCIKY
ncbi:hypothetical protein [Anaeroselena agilis]|uniref:Phage tail collar domain-containing protein n=1 Tax=Anaeroselena agilis TaxID=3063788 RepID=A0ABU3NYE4_9FIRM|nr:hypothetical protein [Selenomonadales bacterium 4137-cl]